jgi:hypothetical protein
VDGRRAAVGRGQDQDIERQRPAAAADMSGRRLRRAGAR